MIPQIETDRLILRAHRETDWPFLSAMWSHPDVTAFTLGRPSTTSESWTRLLRYPGLWSVLGYGYWAIEEKNLGQYIGDIGFADFKREIDPAIAGVPEAGWALDPHVHGQGYATEALSAVLAWGDEHLRVSRTLCLISPQNAVSIRLAKKVGYVDLQTVTLGGQATLLMARDRTRGP